MDSSTHSLLPTTASTTALDLSGNSNVEELQEHKYELVRLARSIIRDANASRVVRDHFAPEYRITRHGQEPMPLEDSIILHRNMKAAYPTYHVEPLSESVDIDFNGKVGTATVWMDVQAAGIPEGVVRQALALWKFRQDSEGRWLCYYQEIFSCSNELLSSGFER